MSANCNILAKRVLLPCCFGVVSALVLVRSAVPAPNYNIVQLGLSDLEHTDGDGIRIIGAQQMNQAGQVSGYAARYNFGSVVTTNLGLSVWIYDGTATNHIGLTGSEHTRSDGYKLSYSDELNEAGHVRGRSVRYNGGAIPLGESNWLYDGATTIGIGLTDSDHTSSDGFKQSESLQMNQAGHVSGHSLRYNGTSEFGQSAWLFNGAATINIGLSGSEYTYTSNGYKYSVVDQLSESGHVRGQSARYDGSNYLGMTPWLYNGTTTIALGLTGPGYSGFSEANWMNQSGQVVGSSDSSAWLYSGGGTIPIGLTDAAHTLSNGGRYSHARGLNEAGQATGISLRWDYSGFSYNSQSAWLYDGNTTIHVGLTDSEHSSLSNRKYSDVYAISNSGQAIGMSYRLLGSDAEFDGLLGVSAWIYDGTNTVKIGLTGPVHTRADGYKRSEAYQLNNAGYVRGYSERYNGGGTSVWLYNGTTTIEIGLTDAEHTDPIDGDPSDGAKVSSSWGMNEAGQVRGQSRRFGPNRTYLGESAFLYDGTTTINIGLTGAVHTRNDGFKYSATDPDFSLDALNEAGQVIGISSRYNGGDTQMGQDAWFYDPLLHQTFSLKLSTRSDGYAYSTAQYLGEDGLVLGSYTLFDALDNDLGSRAFFFTTVDGIHDLGALVEGGLAANGWKSLSGVIRAGSLGQILGYGLPNSQPYGGPYLLTPIAVPEPSAVVLMILAAASFCLRRGLAA